jgi:hypothetical protein
MSLPNYIVFIIILYENVFQNPEHFPTQVSLSSEHSTCVFCVVHLLLRLSTNGKNTVNVKT